MVTRNYKRFEEFLITKGKMVKEKWGQASRLHILFFYFYFTFCEFVKPEPGSFLNNSVFNILIWYIIYSLLKNSRGNLANTINKQY